MTFNQNLRKGFISLVLLALCWGPIHYFLLIWFQEVAPITALIDTIISVDLLAAAGFVVLSALNVFHPTKKQLPAVGIAILLLAFGLNMATEYILNLIDYGDLDYLDLFVGQRLAFFALILVIFLAIAWQQGGSKISKAEEERMAATEKLARDAELASLRQQLQPHFLFNSLNSINALIGSQPEKARTMVQQLSDFLRGTVKKDDSQLVPLHEEIQQLRLYLDIEKVRFGHRLATEIDSDNASLSAKLPPLLIQPVVENAIKFGLYDTVGDTRIRVKSFMEANNLVIEVENPFDPATAAPRQGTGFGLSSLQRRLYLLYARTDLLTTTQHDQTFITQIKIPQP